MSVGGDRVGAGDINYYVCSHCWLKGASPCWLIILPILTIVAMPPKPFGLGGARQRVAMQLAEAKTRSRSPRADRSSAGSSSRPAADANAGQAGDGFIQYVYELFLSNKFSGASTVELVQKASRSGASGMSQLSGAGAGGRRPQHACRDIMRTLAPGAKAPPVLGRHPSAWQRCQNR